MFEIVFDKFLYSKSWVLLTLLIVNLLSSEPLRRNTVLKRWSVSGFRCENYSRKKIFSWISKARCNALWEATYLILFSLFTLCNAWNIFIRQLLHFIWARGKVRLARSEKFFKAKLIYPFSNVVNIMVWCIFIYIFNALILWKKLRWKLHKGENVKSKSDLLHKKMGEMAMPTLLKFITDQ